MAVRLPDTAEPMGNFAGMMAKHIEFEDGDTLQSKLDTGGLGGDGSGYTQLSQAEYDALSDDEKMNGKEYRTYDTGHIYRLGVEFGKDADISRSEVLKTYVSLYNLNTKKGLSLEWENNVDNTQKIIDALEGREEFIDSFSSSTNRIGIVGNYGTTINNFHIIKRSADLAIITATTNDGTILNRTYTNGTLSDWCVNIAVYTSLSELGLTADATLDDVIATMPKGSSALIGVTEFTNAQTMFPYEEGNDYTFGRVYIVKGNDIGRTYTKWFRKDGAKEYIAKIDMNTNSIIGWQQKSPKGLVSNSQNFKIDITKNNASWYGMFTFNFVYGTTPCEITVAITNDVYYTITKGQDVVSAITYTQDGANYIIGIDLTAKVYGTQVVEMPVEFGVVNSLTAEQFTGATTATISTISEEPIILRYNMPETFSYPKYGITQNNTITEVVRAIGNYYVSKYNNNQNITLQVILSTNYNSSTFNKSLPCNGRSSITTITYMPYKFASRVKIETMNTHTGETYLGSLNDSETDDIVWKQIATKTYNSIAELNKAKGTSIELVNGEDNTQKIVDALSVGEQFISLYHNNANQNRFGIDVSYGNLIHELRITKCLDADLTANYATVTAFMNTGCVMSRIYYKTYSTAWSSTKDYVESLLANSQVQ